MQVFAGSSAESSADLWADSYLTVKPIFHCDAEFWRRGLALGNNPRRQNFVLGYQHVGT